MKYKTILLKDMIEEIGEDSTKKVLADFSCPMDEDIESYVKTKAIGFEKAGISRTHLVYAIVDHKALFVGMYSLVSKPLFFDEKLSKKERKLYYGTKFNVGAELSSDPMVRYKEKYVQSILLGQISKNFFNHNNKYITGDILINLAFTKIVEWYRLMGGVCIHLDCQNKEPLKRFYTKHGFIYYKKREVDGKIYLVYVMPIKSLIISMNKLNQDNIEKRSIERLRKINFRGVLYKDKKGLIRKPTV